MKKSVDLARGAPSPTGALIVGIGVLLFSCSKVNVTRLGSTREGRQQFELTCNAFASDSGACHEKALGACGGDYETLDVESAEPRAALYNGQLATAPARRVLLIACNR
jgi:hypothetical protein